MMHNQHNKLRGSASWLLVSALLSCSLAGCRDNSLAYEYKATDLSRWQKTDTVVFDLPQADEARQYNLMVGVRTTNKYRYRYLNLVADVLRGDTLCWSDTIQFEIYNKTGMPTGDGFPFIESEKEISTLALQPGGNYTIRIAHLMHKKSIRGVADIGIRVKSEK